MKVICVYRSGGDFNAMYVAALSASLAQFCPVPYDFYCLTDLPLEVDKFANVIELKHGWPGWWSKIELFNPDLPFNQDGDVKLYFDLDVLVLKEIQELIQICFSSDSPVMLRCRNSLGAKNDWPSSSIMSWKGSMMSGVYDEFVNRGSEVVMKEAQNKIYMAGQRTDQGFIRTIIQPNKFQDFLPAEYITFKLDYLDDPGLFDRTHILNWTGSPRYPDMTGSFSKIKEVWKINNHVQNNQKYEKIN